MDDWQRTIEERVNRIEGAQTMQSANLQNIETKIDKIIEHQENLDERFVRKDSCRQELFYDKEGKRETQAKIEKISNEFTSHLKDHYNKTDRFANWLSTGLISAFVLAKLANLI